MKKIKSIITIISIALALNVHAQDAYLCKDGNVSFFSTTPIRDISAVSKLAVGYIKPSTKYIKFQVGITSFVFENALMQEHFNENYVESGKYPYTVFKGQINETIDWTKDGTYPITATGMLSMHGVTKTITEKGILTIANGVPTITNHFNIKFTDYGVEIPSLLIKQLSDAVEVSVNCTYVPLKK